MSREVAASSSSSDSAALSRRSSIRIFMDVLPLVVFLGGRGGAPCG
ncbi:hypothetical protein [Nonomuraea sp. NPDC050783]